MSSAGPARSGRGHVSTKLTASSGGWTTPSVLSQGASSGSALHVRQGRTPCLGAWVPSGAGEAAGTGALTWVNNECAVL